MSLLTIASCAKCPNHLVLHMQIVLNMQCFMCKGVALYSTCLTAQVYHRSRHDMTWRRLDLKRINFAPGAPVKSVARLSRSPGTPLPPPREYRAVGRGASSFSPPRELISERGGEIRRISD